MKELRGDKKTSTSMQLGSTAAENLIHELGEGLENPLETQPTQHSPPPPKKRKAKFKKPEEQNVGLSLDQCNDKMDKSQLLYQEKLRQIQMDKQVYHTKLNDAVQQNSAKKITTVFENYTLPSYYDSIDAEECMNMAKNMQEFVSAKNVEKASKYASEQAKEKLKELVE